MRDTQKGRDLSLDNQALSRKQNKRGEILDIPGTLPRCLHKMQFVRQIGTKAWQLCFQCGRKLFVR